MDVRKIINRHAVIEQYIVGRDVLDIGCVDARPGNVRKYDITGLHRFILSKANAVTGVDLDEVGVAEMHGKGYDVLCANAENMALGRRFSRIVAGEVIEHVDNAGLFLATLKRHLAPEGRIVLTTPNAFGIHNFFHIVKKNRIRVHPDHTCWYDPQTLAQLLARYDLEIEEIFFTNKARWYNKKYFYKIFKYQLPRLLTTLRPYFSTTIVAVVKEKSDQA